MREKKKQEVDEDEEGNSAEKGIQVVNEQE